MKSFKIADRIKMIFKSPNSWGDDNHIIVLHKYKAIYFAIPKVANSSLKAVCVNLLDIDLPPEYWKPNVFNAREIVYLTKRRDILIKKSEVEKYRDYWKFGFVRNPWDRLVSCYTEKIRDKDFIHPDFVNGVSKSLLRFPVFRAKMSFEEFVCAVADIPDNMADRHFRSQYCFVMDEKGALYVDFLGRFESLNESFLYVCEKLNISGVQLPHLLKREREHYRKYYNERLKDIVARRYAKDIEIFGYDF